MIVKLIAVVTSLVLLAFIFERLITKYANDNEPLRKLVHVFHGAALAILAFIIPLPWIIGVEVFFLISMVVARYLSENFYRVPWIRYFARVYKVGRLSYGEFFFPLSIILLVFIANTKWEFAAAVLILGIADAAAALVGKRYGKRISYKVLGQTKTLAGSLAFFVVSLLIVAGFVAENLGVYGSDNFLIPIVAVVLLNAL